MLSRRTLLRWVSLLLPGRYSLLEASPRIGREERAKRAEDFRQTEASLRLSGLTLDAGTRRIFERYISGELTLAGVGAKIDALHKRTLAGEKEHPHAG